MIAFFWISLLFFALGAIGSSRIKISYICVSAGSVSALITGFYALTAHPLIVQYAIIHRLTISLGIDHLTGLFMVIASVSWLALALYSIDYSKLYPQKRIALGFNLCLFGMMLILTAQDGFSLLIGWEIMTVFAFIMMLTQGKNFAQAYRFLAFGELSTACLLIGFAVLFENTGSISFAAIKGGSPLMLVLLSLGFIIKMDIVPFHGWMRGIYGEIPDNVAAILSAPVTLMGVYGMERIIPLVPKNETWNIVLILLGAISAFWGGLQAVAASKVRLLPAYSTIENNGMILTAIGFYAIADGINLPGLHYLSLFALAASLIMALAHTFTKTLMFMSLGHAKEAYNVENIDHARGVWSGVGKIPALGIVISALSFSAFPPLIGYVGEWMVLETLFQSYRFPNAATEFLAAVAGVLIALAIGLIGFAMVKLIGYTALGYDHGRKRKHIPNRFLHITEISMEVLVVLCGIGLPVLIIWLGFPQLLIGLLGIPKPFVLASGNPIFGVISPTFIAIIMIVLLIIPVWTFSVKRKSVRKVHSWNGGVRLEEQEFFSAPAYSQILEHILRRLYHTREVRTETQGSIEVEDILVRPTRALTRFVQKIGEGEALILMNGKISAYVTYILVLFILVFVIGVMAT
jgi:formate hydrogenlyase subunit 3/multisubunit Na+/H+ antiporter MnhD subunit